MSNSTSQQEFDNCVSSIAAQYSFFSWFTVYLLFLPLFLFVLFIIFNKYTSSQSSASGALSHADVFTLHMIAMEMTSIAGAIFISYGFSSINSEASSFGGNIVLSTSTGQMLFHSLTCVERYLAVVHPVTYLSLKRSGGVTIRNISITSVWAFSVVYVLMLHFVNNSTFYTLSGFILSFALLPLVLYCTVCVLCVLIRPKPGERGGHRKELNQSKRSIVYTMVVILGVLLLRLMINVVYNGLFFSPWLKFPVCVVTILSIWAALPSSLVLPLLFLHSAGKLKCV